MICHETAIVDPAAEIDDTVEIGPYCVIGPEVHIGGGTRLGPHIIVEGRTWIGRDNFFTAQSSIGSAPQDLKYRGEPTEVRIGDRNVIREFCTVNRGTAAGGGATRIGNDNFFMTTVHIAHDSVIEDHTILANAATLAGHVHVFSHATIGAFSGVHQFCRVGPHAYIAGYSVITRDVLPYIKTVGYRNEARLYGINTIGLERKGFSREIIADLKRAYRVLFRSGKNMGDAVRELRQAGRLLPETEVLVRFIETAERGVTR